MVSLKTSALLALVAAAPAMAANIVANGGFETAGDSPTISAFWRSGTVHGFGDSISQRSLATPFSGGGAHHLVTDGLNELDAESFITQNSITDAGLVSLAPGSSVSLSFMGNYSFGRNGVGAYVLRILNSAGEIVADTGPQTVTGSTNGYQMFSTSSLVVPAFGAAPNDSFAAFVGFSVITTGHWAPESSSAFIDDVVIDATLVPAPSALALMGAGLLVAGRRRRASK